MNTLYLQLGTPFRAKMSFIMLSLVWRALCGGLKAGIPVLSLSCPGGDRFISTRDKAVKASLCLLILRELATLPLSVPHAQPGSPQAAWVLVISKLPVSVMISLFSLAFLTEMIFFAPWRSLTHHCVSSPGQAPHRKSRHFFFLTKQKLQYGKADLL